MKFAREEENPIGFLQLVALYKNFHLLLEDAIVHLPAALVHPIGRERGVEWVRVRPAKNLRVQIRRQLRRKTGEPWHQVALGDQDINRHPHRDRAPELRKLLAQDFRASGEVRETAPGVRIIEQIFY